MIDQEILDSPTRIELAKTLLKSLVDKDSKRKWRKYRREKARIRMLNRECRESKSALKDLFEVCLQDFSPVTSPLVLISQIQRSGGTLLAQLFDSHPEIHAHPHELKIGKPKKYIWPKIDLNDNFERWFYILFEVDTIEHFKRGYRKEG